ncbi:MAG: glycerol-3-phosphate responsive antiterminator [Eubacterium sp.]|nr:glycerol-3-phosphate responsive antiterminator [Eubacterium sp.]
MRNEFQIIPSVTDLKNFEYALEVPGDTILLAGTHIGNLKGLAKTVHDSGKKVIVNHETVGGLGNDRTSFHMLKNLFRVDGILGSSPAKLNTAKGLDFMTIFRLPLMDSQSVKKGLSVLKELRADVVELRPYYHAVEFLPEFREVHDGPFYVAGYVNTREKLLRSIEAGFSGVITSTRSLWDEDLSELF